MRHVKTIRNALCISAFLLCPILMSGQTFKAAHLQKAYEKLHLSNPANREGLSLRADRQGMIEHIGIPIFSSEMRTLMPSPIYDYLEYALLNHKYRISENTLQEQKIRFRNGTWEDLEQISPESDCTIDNRDNKWYIATWNTATAKPLSVAIPIDYELLANSSRKEMEQDFAQALKRFKPSAPKPFIVEEDELESLHRDGLLVKKGGSFLMPQINSDTYYKLTLIRETGMALVQKHSAVPEEATLEEEIPMLLVSNAYPRETWANILLTPHHADIDVSLSLELLFAGYHKEAVKVSLAQWMGYCGSEGCSPYYIYEGEKDGRCVAILMMYNRSAGYAHLAYLHSPKDQFEAKAQTYTGKVYMFIPTSNIQELFGKVSNRKSRPKKYE